MKRKNRHSRESGNPVLILFKIYALWVPAFAGMTNYDTAPLAGKAATGDYLKRSHLSAHFARASKR
jgi:hypothetical protein